MKNKQYIELILKEYHIVKINNLDCDKYKNLIEILFLLENNNNCHMFVEGMIKEFNFSTIRKYIKGVL